MTQDNAEYLEELARTLASHGSNLAALRMAELEQRLAPSFAAPGVPTALAGSGGALGGLATAYSPSVAVGGAGLFVKDGAITVSNAGSVVIIDGTSNMFKIAATGTFLSPSHTDAGSFTSQVDLSTGLTYVPATHSWFEGAVGTALAMPYLIIYPAGHLFDAWKVSIKVVNTNQTRLTCYLDTTRSGYDVGYTIRYFLCVEAAI